LLFFSHDDDPPLKYLFIITPVISAKKEDGKSVLQNDLFIIIGYVETAGQKEGSHVGPASFSNLED